MMNNNSLLEVGDVIQIGGKPSGSDPITELLCF